MQIAFSIVILLVIGVFGAVHFEGYPNFIGSIALGLRRHGKRMQAMHDRRAAKLREDWVRELEG